MTLTIELTPEAEVHLRAEAARQGQDPAVVAARVLAEALEAEAQDRAEAIEGIQRGLDDFDAGRFRHFSEFAAEQRRKHNLATEG